MDNSSLAIFQQFGVTSDKKRTRTTENNGVIYTRVSTKEQAENNLSLGTQMKACEEYAQKYSINIVNYFGGTYESAKTDERKEFVRMLSFVKRSKEKIRWIVVYNVDRFSRTGANGIYIANELKKQGISILSVTQPADTDTPSGRLQQNIHFIFSQYDNEVRRERTMAGTREKLLRGYWIGAPPVGYDKIKINKEEKIVINETGKLIKKAFYWRAYHRMSSNDIAAKLRKLGMNMYHQKLSNIFHNPFYCGLIAHKALNGQVIEGKHPALVSKDIFLKVNDILRSERFKGKHAKEMPEVPLKHFVKCATHTNRVLTGYLVKKKGLYYYKCGVKGCKSNRSAKVFHEKFKELLDQFTINSNLIQPIRKQLYFRVDQLTQDNRNQEKLLKERLKEIETKIEKAQEKHFLGEIDSGVYEKFMPKYKQEKSQILIEIQKLEEKSSNLDKFIDKFLEMLPNLANLWDSGTLKAREHLQHLVFPEGIFYDRKSDEVRTSRINTLFLITKRISDIYEGMKKGHFENFDETSLCVGAAGFEPAAPCSQSRCANRTAPRPDVKCEYGV